MKKYILAFLFSLSGNTISNSVCANYIINPGSAKVAIKDLMNLKVSEFIMLSPKEYSTITGKKMNLPERISFSILKVRMKHTLKKNPNMKAGEYIDKHKKISTVGWIVIGLVIALIIIAIIYAIAAATAAVSATAVSAVSASSAGCGFGGGG